MTEAFNNRAKHWNISKELETPSRISDFEKSSGISLPEEYKELLQKYGKLKHTKTWYWYFEEDGVSDHLIDCTFDLDDQRRLKDSMWKEILTYNSIINEQDYLPIIATHSNNYSFLIGINEENKGKIYDYDYDYEDYEPKLVAESLYEFFTKKIYSSFSFHPKSKQGTIEIQRSNGVEFWDVTSLNLSISKVNGKNSLNFWVESYYEKIKALDDTGDTPVMYEIKIPLETIPDFSDPWKFNVPALSQVSENWGEESDFEYYDNFYYFDHDCFDKQTLEIVKGKDDLYFVKLTGEKDDPLSSEYGKAKYIISAKLKLSDKFKGYWCEE